MKSLPCHLSMWEKHTLWGRLSGCSISEVEQQLEEKPTGVRYPFVIDCVLYKLFTGLLWVGFSLKDLYEQADVCRRADVTEAEMVRTMSHILSEYECVNLLDVVINKGSFN